MTTITICSDNSSPQPGFGLTVSPSMPRATCWTFDYNPQWHGNTPSTPYVPDNPDIPTAVPVAGTLALMALGGVAWLVSRRGCDD
jgi:uncharacterized protein (TIGR03382 family)